jgi:hypothetical protein
VWSVQVCIDAASKGQHDILRWIRSQNPPCPWNADVCLEAAKNGHLSVLKWLRIHNDPPCDWDVKACLAAATEANINQDMVQWLKKEANPAMAKSALLARDFTPRTPALKASHDTLNAVYQNKIDQMLNGLLDD